MAAALEKYNASKNDGVKATNLANYNTILASHTAAVTKVASDLTASQTAKTALDSATATLVTVTSAYNVADKNLADEKALTATLKANLSAAKAAHAAAVKAYNAAAKEAAKNK